MIPWKPAAAVVVFALVCATVTPGTAQEAVKESAATATESDKDAVIRELQDRVAKLEARLAEVEKRLGSGGGPAAAAPDRAAIDALRVKAQARMRQDLEKRSREEVREAEQLYQVANKNWRSPEAKASLEQMIKRFPDLNRTGCAILYLGQMSEGDERVKLLQTAIDNHGDCFYGNGVQVGAFARLLLGHHYKEAGDAEKAKKLFDQLRNDFPDAVDHRGRPLAGQIPAE